MQLFEFPQQQEHKDVQKNKSTATIYDLTVHIPTRIYS